MQFHIKAAKGVEEDFSVNYSDMPAFGMVVPGGCSSVGGVPLAGEPIGPDVRLKGDCARDTDCNRR
jgi:hypothetical protein